MLKIQSTCKDVKCGWIDFCLRSSLNRSTTNEDTNFGCAEAEAYSDVSDTGLDLN